MLTTALFVVVLLLGLSASFGCDTYMHTEHMYVVKYWCLISN